MRNNLWIGSGVSGMGGIPMLGTGKRGLTTLIKSLFSLGEQGFAYDPNDLTAEKLNWRKNQLLHTEDFTAAAWGKVDTTLVKNNIANPFGALGVFKICPNKQTLPATDSDIRQTISKKGSGVFSVYLKKAERNFACINVLGRNPTGSEGRLIVDLTTKAVKKVQLQRDFIIQEVGDGWLRVALIFENFASLDVEVRVQVAENINSYATTGDGTTGIYAYAPQLEFFTDAPSTYQPITDFNSEFIKQFPLHTLYQDAAGGVPVTAAGQPVGLMLDKSKGLILGLELSNYSVGFSSLAGISPTGVTLSLEGTALVITAQAGTSRRAEIPISGLTVGKFYKIKFIARKNEINGLQNLQNFTAFTKFNYQAFVTSTSTIEYSLILEATAVSGVLRAYAASAEAIGAQMIVESISVKEVVGNHAYQTVSASRPILQQTPILGSELAVNGDFSNGTNGWETINCTQAVSGGENTITANGAGFPSVYSDIACSVGKTYVITATCRKGSGASQVGIQVNGIAGVFTSSMTNVPLQYKFVATSSQHRVAFAINGATTNGDTATVDNISAKEITGYHTDQNYLAFDGADDFLQTNSIDFTATDKISLFAGVRKLSDSDTGMVFELSPDLNTNNGGFYLAAPAYTNSNDYSFSSKGTVIIYAAGTGYPSPTTNVLTAKSVISIDSLTVRVDGAEKMLSVADQGVGNYGNHQLFIGRRGGTSLPFSGHLYGLIGIGKLTSDSETIALEKSIAKNTGVTLNV